MLNHVREFELFIYKHYIIKNLLDGGLCIWLQKISLNCWQIHSEDCYWSNIYKTCDISYKYASPSHNKLWRPMFKNLFCSQPNMFLAQISWSPPSVLPKTGSVCRPLCFSVFLSKAYYCQEWAGRQDGLLGRIHTGLVSIISDRNSAFRWGSGNQLSGRHAACYSAGTRNVLKAVKQWQRV